MRLNLFGAEVSVKFWHGLTDIDNVGGQLITETRKVTACKIGEQEPVFAVCNPKDQFCKSTGRKIAFAKALSKTTFSKVDREQLWIGYFNRIKG